VNIIAIDPGPERSALVYLQDGRPTFTLLDRNEAVRDALLMDTGTFYAFDEMATVVIEQVESFGMPVGREVFETVFWAGRFAECWGGPWARLPRRAVKMHHCRSNRANDAAIRQALLDRFGPGREKAIGIKKAPGPLYSIKQDLWSALALGPHVSRNANAG
jgi:hypothetical protein